MLMIPSGFHRKSGGLTVEEKAGGFISAWSEEEKIYICIDLKSFYASVECAERGLDPFTTNLIVADPTRGDATVCLAITPAMKALGIRNRCRVYEIPKGVQYIVAPPRMKKYMQVSAEIYSIYLKFVAEEDIHVYSVDECFIDATEYLRMYSQTPKEFAKSLMDEVFCRTKISATAGIGTNLFLAKVALDITAKRIEDRMGYLDQRLFRKTIWRHQPITDIWNIGGGIARRLEKFGITDLYGVAHCNEEILYREFGVNAELLIDHAWGIEPCTIADIHAYRPKSNSLSNGQILPTDYTYDEALLILKEMVDGLVLELVEKGLVADGVSLYVGYAKNTRGHSGGSMKLSGYTNSARKLLGYFTDLFERTTDRRYGIRRITVGFNRVAGEDFADVDLFTDFEAEKKEHDLQKTLIGIKHKFGKNAILKGMSYEEKATARERNTLIGGHRGGEEKE